MKLTLTLEADSVNVQALNVYSLRVVDAPEQHTTDSPPPFTALTDIRSLQYRTYHGKGQRLAVLTVTSDE